MCMLADKYSLEKTASASHPQKHLPRRTFCCLLLGPTRFTYPCKRAWDDFFCSGLSRALSMHRGVRQMCSTHLPEFQIPVYIIQESDHIPSRTPESWKHSNEFPDRMSPTFPEQEIPVHPASRCCLA